MKKVFVSGCYDLLHSGHVAFLKEASTYGKLYVGIGSDETIKQLKGRNSINNEIERLYMVKSIRYVEDAWINSGSGFLDFKEEILKLKPDVFIVNEDGNSPLKLDFCNKNNIDYKVLKRIPDLNLEPKSTTDLIKSNNCLLPYRLDLAGTWIDQPYVNKYSPGWAITISLEPIIEYNERSGMSTSTRNAAKKLWPFQLPQEHPEKLAKILFHFENEPGRKEVSGAQDSIGICLPGVSRHYYSDGYWPTKIESIHDEEIINWLEKHIYLITLWPREDGLNLLDKLNINLQNVKDLTKAADLCWDGIINMNIEKFSEGFLNSFNAQIKMFPKMINNKIINVINNYKDKALAWKLSGAGAGGYLILISENDINGAMKLKIRRKGTL